MIESGRYSQSPHDKRLLPVCDSNEIEHEIHFLCYCPKYLNLRNEFFFAQIQSHLRNFQQLSYSDLVIKLMKSEDIYLKNFAYVTVDMYCRVRIMSLDQSVILLS